MASLNEVLHEIVDTLHGKSTQAADALHAKVDEAVEKPAEKPAEEESTDA